LDEFRVDEIFSNGTYCLFIILILLVVKNQQHLGHFRIISSVDYIYKIIVKIIASRLKTVIGSVIH